MSYKNDDLLTLIERCIDKGHLQQALTIYTEEIPEYLFETKCFSLSQDKEKQFIIDDLNNRENFSSRQGMGFFILNTFEPPDADSKQSYKEYICYLNSTLNNARSELCKLFKNIIGDILNNRCTIEEVNNKLLRFKKNYPLIRFILEKRLQDVVGLVFKMKNVTNDIENLNLWKQLIDIYMAANLISRDKWENFKIGTRNVKLKRFLRSGMTQNGLINFIGGLRLSYAEQLIHRLTKTSSGTWIDININESEFRDIIDRYICIKNKYNHVKEEEILFTNSNLAEYMKEGITQIRKVKKPVNINF